MEFKEQYEDRCTAGATEQVRRSPGEPMIRNSRCAMT
jgi:hypothetical protein